MLLINMKIDDFVIKIIQKNLKIIIKEELSSFLFLYYNKKIDNITIEISNNKNTKDNYKIYLRRFIKIQEDKNIYINCIYNEKSEIFKKIIFDEI